MTMSSKEKEFQSVADGFFSKKTAQRAQEAPVVPLRLNSHEAQQVYSDPIVSRQTQGKKGQKLSRFHAAFSPENHAYLRDISRIEGMSATEYLDRLVGLDRVTKQGIINQVKSALGSRSMKDI